MTARTCSRAALIVLLMSASWVASQNAQGTGSVESAKWKISGVVLHSTSNEPLAGIEVSIAPTEQRDASLQTVTQKDGRFSFENLARGKYSLVAQGRGFSQQAYQQHGAFSTAIAVGPELKSENLIFRLVLDGSISGSVLDEDNEPVRTGLVHLFRRGNPNGAPELERQAALDEQGRYHFAHLHPGTYLLAVSAQPWYAQDSQAGARPLQRTVEGSAEAGEAGDDQSAVSSNPALDVAYPITYYPGVTEAASATPIVLGAGERFSADLTLRAVPALHVTIRTVGGDPSRPVSAIAMQRIFEGANAPQVALAVQVQGVGPGTVRVGGLAPGHLLLSLRALSGSGSPDFKVVNARDWLIENRELDLTADTEIDTTESSVPPLSIEGMLQLPDGEKLPPRASIGFRNRSTGESFSAEISSKATFKIQQALGGPGKFETYFNAGGLRVRGITAAGAAVAGRTVQLPRTGSVQLKVTLAKSLARIEGTVFEENKPISEAMVLLVPESPEKDEDLFRRDQSDSDGTFSLMQVMPGRYTLVAIRNGWDLDWRDPGVLKPYLDHGQKLEIDSLQTYKASLKVETYVADSAKASQP